MPECICFLYHSMGGALNDLYDKAKAKSTSTTTSHGSISSGLGGMVNQQNKKRVAKVQPRGTFLSECVKPIYEVISKKAP